MYADRYEGANFRGAPTWGIQARDSTNLKPAGRLATGGFPPISPPRTGAIPNFSATRDIPVPLSPPRNEAVNSRGVQGFANDAEYKQAFTSSHQLSRNIGTAAPAATYRSSAADVSIRSVDSVGPMGDIYNLPREPPSVNKPRLSYDQEQSAMACGKDSVSQRLPEVERLRYHIPGYMGFVRRQQFHHGQTYGATTRSCILGYKPDSTPAL